MADSDLVTLAECPPGPFEFEGTLGFKTEYGSMRGTDLGNGQVGWAVSNYSDVYCIESGETFWGGVTSHDEREKLMVRPVDVRAVVDA